MSSRWSFRRHDAWRIARRRGRKQGDLSHKKSGEHRVRLQKRGNRNQACYAYRSSSHQS